jgi:hypothetical protein
MTIRREYDEALQLGFYLFWYDEIGVMTPDERLAIMAVVREAKSLDVPSDEVHHSVEPYVQRLDLAYRRVGERVLGGGYDLSFVNRCPRCCRIVRTSKARQCMWCHHDWHEAPGHP